MHAQQIYNLFKNTRPVAFNFITIFNHLTPKKLWENQYFTCYLLQDGSKYAIGPEYNHNLLRCGMRWNHRWHDGKRWIACGSF